MQCCTSRPTARYFYLRYTTAVACLFGASVCKVQSRGVRALHSAVRVRETQRTCATLSTGMSDFFDEMQWAWPVATETELAWHPAGKSTHRRTYTHGSQMVCALREPVLHAHGFM
jgi:hypothetical protein